MKTVFGRGVGRLLMAAAAALAVAACAQSEARQAPPGGTGWVNPDNVPAAAPEYQPDGQDGFSQQELAQLLAPVALYPDTLLTQVLTAATYPLEVVEADRWIRAPENAALKGDALARALDAENWDPSVKSLAPFPEVLHMMSDKLDWMQDLGEAFLAQEGDVMAMVQQLRQQAAAAGTLKSTPQQAVRRDGPDILVVPANPQVVYVPYYDPFYAYGAWGYPDYPPYYFGGPAYVGRPGLYFGSSIFILSSYWGWSSFDWRDRYVHIDPYRYNRINHHRPPVTSRVWSHDPYHRRGVYYHNVRVRDRYAGPDGRPDRRWRDRDWVKERDRDWAKGRDRDPQWDRGARRPRDGQPDRPGRRGGDAPLGGVTVPNIKVPGAADMVREPASRPDRQIDQQRDRQIDPQTDRATERRNRWRDAPAADQGSPSPAQTDRAPADRAPVDRTEPRRLAPSGGQPDAAAPDAAARQRVIDRVRAQMGQRMEAAREQPRTQQTPQQARPAPQWTRPAVQERPAPRSGAAAERGQSGRGDDGGSTDRSRWRERMRPN